MRKSVCLYPKELAFGLLWAAWAFHHHAQALRISPSRYSESHNHVQARNSSIDTRLLEGREFHRLLSDASSSNEHLVSKLSGLDHFASKQWAGLLTVDQASGGKLFYWLFEAETDPLNQPLLIWLNGGPGCSSMDGLFLENGPFKVDPSLKLSLNPHSWHKAMNVLYVDQPVGTGFSFTSQHKYCDNDDCIEQHFFTFLQALFNLHTWLRLSGGDEGGFRSQTRPIYFSGESQAGHYIPSIVDYIVAQNKGKYANTPQQLYLDVKGMAIGNGWFDPPTQYDVSDFAHGVGMISEGQAHTLQHKRLQCQRALKAGKYYYPMCFSLLDDVISATGSEQAGYVSLYDYRIFDNLDDRSFPPGHKDVERYMNQPAVKQALHATESPLVFQECTDPPYDHLKHQDGLGVTPEIGRSLDAGVRALFFNGAYDIICNHYGNEQALKDVAWSGQEAFQAAGRGVWLPRDSPHPAGYAKSSGPLTFLVVLNAGHMVPMDVPVQAFDMISRFVQGRSLSDRPQNLAMTVVPATASPVTGLVVSALPPPPKLTSVKVLSHGTISLIIEAPARTQPSNETYYTILANPGGSLWTPQRSQDGQTYTVSGLREGTGYSVQAIANNAGGASQPSEAIYVFLGCDDDGSSSTHAGEATGTPCHHGVCGFDEEQQRKRCFCYQGWEGRDCGAQRTAKADAGNMSSNSSRLVSMGRVAYATDASCTEQSGSDCALRFKVPLRLTITSTPTTSTPTTPTLPTSSSNQVDPTSGRPTALLDSTEETRAFESMLRKDLAYSLGINREQVNLRSLTSSSALWPQPPRHRRTAAIDGSSAQAHTIIPSPAVNPDPIQSLASHPVILDFDVLDIEQPKQLVATFSHLWSAPQSPFAAGLVTSNFDLQHDALITLTALDTPLSGRSPLTALWRQSPVLNIMVAVLVVLCVVCMIRTVRKRSWASWWRGRRREQSDDRVGMREEGDGEAEMTEMRTTSSSGYSKPSRSGSSGRANGLGAGVSRTVVGDGANERLVGSLSV